MRILVLAIASIALVCNASTNIVIDCSKIVGEFKPLNSINGGILVKDGTYDLTEPSKKAAFPMFRLHDCVFAYHEVVDVHCIFRDFRNDPSNPDNYFFARTDDYLLPILTNGFKVVYRLGESIEHTPKKYFINAPDPHKWAEICKGIIRHYNHGWANGFHYGIVYWEIWSEPENYLNWKGSDEAYFQLYDIASKEIKKEFPYVKIGGPSMGNPCIPRDNYWVIQSFTASFLEYCRARRSPIDFFSWHNYSNSPYEVCSKAKVIREALNNYGYTNSESHLNEWGHLPGNSWEGHISKSHKEAQKWSERVNSFDGAAYTMAVMLDGQDAPIDAAFTFNSDTGRFGIYDQWGTPRPTWYALQAFSWVLSGTNIRIKTTNQDRVSVGAGVSKDKSKVQVLVSHRANPEKLSLSVTNLPWSGQSIVEVFEVTEDSLAPIFKRSMGSVSVPLTLSSSSVVLIRVMPK